MEWGRVKEWIGKYRYAVAILVVGIALMLLPDAPQSQVEEPETGTELSMEDHLQRILSQIEGAGRVEVLLTEAKGSTMLYQTDTQRDSSGDRESSENKTVIVTDSQHNEAGLIVREDPPVYLGAVIACQGGDRGEVCLAVVEAVRCATGLGANQICVVKMK